MHANPDKTQTCAFHLKNREASMKLNITWSIIIHKLKCKTSARNNIFMKLSNTKWGAKPPTIKTIYFALCYSTAEYACPVWEGSTHISNLDSALDKACRSITGCLRPTSVENVYLLAGIVPPGVRMATTSRQEIRKQTER